MSSAIETIIREISSGNPEALYGGYSSKNYREAFKYIIEVLFNPESRVEVKKGRVPFSEFQSIAIRSFSEGACFETDASTWEFKKAWPYLLMLRNVERLGLLHIMTLASAKYALGELQKLIRKSGSEKEEYSWSFFINQRDENGYAPLHYAAIVTGINEKFFTDTEEYGDSSKKIPQEEMLRYLLQKKACVNLTTAKGHTPLDLIIGLQQFDAPTEIKAQLQKKADILRQWGGDEQAAIDPATFEMPDVDAPNIEFFALPPLAARQKPESISKAKPGHVRGEFTITPQSESYSSDTQEVSPKTDQMPTATSAQNQGYSSPPYSPETPRLPVSRRASHETLSSSIASSKYDSITASAVSSFSGQPFFFHSNPSFDERSDTSEDGYVLLDDSPHEYPPELRPFGR